MISNDSTNSENRGVQSKLRNGKGRRTANSGFTVPASPAKSDSGTPAVSKRTKTKPADLDLSPLLDAKGNKRNRSLNRNTPVSSTSSEPGTPQNQPSSPVLIECPEPNCSKKYKHINGLKYHQTHAHCVNELNTKGDLDNKDANSDIEDSNFDANSLPSSPKMISNENIISDNSDLSTLANVALNDSIKDNQISTFSMSSIQCEVFQPNNEPFKHQEPIKHQESFKHQTSNSHVIGANTIASGISTATIESANLFLVSNPNETSIETTPNDESMEIVKLPSSHISGGKSQMGNVDADLYEGVKKDKKHKKKSKDKEKVKDDQPIHGPDPLQVDIENNITPSIVMQSSNSDIVNPINPLTSTCLQSNSEAAFSASVINASKDLRINNENANAISNPQIDQIENVQSPAYSDISDANETEPGDNDLDSNIDKPDDVLSLDKQIGDIANKQTANFSIYPYFNQPPYLLSMTQPSGPSTGLPPTLIQDVRQNIDNLSIDSKAIESENVSENLNRSDESVGKIQTDSVISEPPTHEYPSSGFPYPYGYMQGYIGFPNESNYPMHLITSEQQKRFIKDPKETSPNDSEKSRISSGLGKELGYKEIPSSTTTRLPHQNRPEVSSTMKTNIIEKQSENHQILKENIEMKSQMDVQSLKNKQKPFADHPFDSLSERSKEEGSPRYFMDRIVDPNKSAEIEGQRKEGASKSNTMTMKHASSPKSPPNISFSKDVPKKDKNEKDLFKKKVKDEGIKPTMETTGPPPPPTNGYYFNPSFLQAHHFPQIPPFDPSHPMFRSSSINPIIGAPYPPPFLHPQLHPRFANDIPVGPLPPTPDPVAAKLHPGTSPSHYSSHKIHELQERALISPNSNSCPPISQTKSSSSLSSGKSSDIPSSPSSKSEENSMDRQRSPPPQRHLHTHHHTHVGVGYPIYDPYGGKLILLFDINLVKLC